MIQTAPPHYRRLRSHDWDDSDDSDDSDGELVERKVWTPCGECKSRGVKCSVLDGYPCSNCQEEGIADKCKRASVVQRLADTTELREEAIARLDAASEAVKQSKAISTITNKKDVFFKSIRYILASPLQAFWVLVFLLQRVYICIGLLCLPVYYASQADQLLQAAGQCDRDYFRWSNEYEEHENVQPGTSDSSPDLATTIRELPEMPLSVHHLLSAWSIFLDERKGEWNILLTISGVLLASSLTIFQVPGASEDYIIRTFTFLSIGNAMLAVVYGAIYVFHFRLSHATNVHYAYLWMEDVRNNPGTFRFWNLWVMLALPAVSTFWSAFLFMCAIFAYIWRTGDATDPGDSSPLPTTPVFALRAVIQGLFVIALAYVGTSLATLHRLKREAMKKRGPAVPQVPTLSPSATMLDNTTI